MQGDLGAPLPLPPGMLAIMESQNTKTHSSERTDTVCCLESRDGHDPFTRGGKGRKKDKEKEKEKKLGRGSSLLMSFGMAGGKAHQG